MSKSWSDWQVIYEDRWTREFQAIVRKRLAYSQSHADETMLEVRQELAIKFCEIKDPPASPDAYIRAAFRNTLEDYLRKKEGYPRPPAWIKRLGAIYEKVFKLLCLESRSVNDIHAIMENLYKVTRQFIEQVITEVRAGIPNCGAWRESVGLENVENLSIENSSTATPEQILENMNANAIVAAILGEKENNIELTGQLYVALESLREFSFSDDERLLLRLIYTEGHPVSTAARILQMTDGMTRKLLRDVIERLGDTLKNAGILAI